MAIKLVREFQQKQQLAMTPQLKRSIDLLQLSRLEIINKINTEIENNPFLIKESEEALIADYDDEEILANLAEPISLQQSLKNQLNDLSLSESEKKIGITLIQSLDNNGLLSMGLEQLEELMRYENTVDEIHTILKDVIQTLDPAGIGARNFKELIFLQLQRKDLSDDQRLLVSEILYNPTLNNFEEAKSELIKKFSIEEIEHTLALIKSCDLSPGLNFESIDFIQPDIEIVEEQKTLTVNFINDHFPKLYLDTSLEKLTKENPGNIKLQEKISEAKWLIKSVEKRNETIKKVGTLICYKQVEFLLNKSIQLNSLSNVELAKELKLSPSTISRILRAKYIQTPKGAILMKSLLSASVSKTRKVTSLQLMEEIQRVIFTSSSKISDQKISEKLNQRGFSLARRTIAKYRTKMLIPNSRKR